MDLLLVADQKVEPGWVCGTKGLQEPHEPRQWTREKGDGRRKFRCFRSNELREMMNFNPDLRRAPWFASIPDLDQDEFLLLLFYRVTEIRTVSTRDGSCVQELVFGPVGSVLFTQINKDSCPLDQLERNLKEDFRLNCLSGKKMKYLESYDKFIKRVFYAGTRRIALAHDFFQILDNYILGNDSAHVPILARINFSPVAMETSNIVGKDPFKETEGSQVSKRLKNSDQFDVSEHAQEDPVIRSRSKGLEVLAGAGKQHVSGILTKLDISSSGIHESHSQSSRQSTTTAGTVTTEEKQMTGDALGTCERTHLQGHASNAHTRAQEGPVTRSRSKGCEVLPDAETQHVSSTGTLKKLENSGSGIHETPFQSATVTVTVTLKGNTDSSASQTFEHTQSRGHANSVGDAASGLFNPLSSKSSASPDPCATNNDLHEELRDTYVKQSSIPLGSSMIQQPGTNAFPHNSKDTLYDSTDTSITNTSNLTNPSISTATFRTNIATSCTDALTSFTNTAPAYTETRTTSANTNAAKHSEPLQRLGKYVTTTNITQSPENQLFPGASQCPRTSTYADANRRLSEAISRVGSKNHPSETTSSNEDQHTEAAVSRTSESQCFCKCPHCIKSTLIPETMNSYNSAIQHSSTVPSDSNVATSTTKSVKPPKTVPSTSDTRCTISAQSTRGDTSSLSSKTSISSQNHRTPSSSLVEKTTRASQGMRSATLVQDSREATAALGLEGTSASLNTKISTSELIVQTTASAQDNGTISTQNNRSTTSAQDTKIDMSAQGSKTVTSSQDTKTIASAQDIKTVNMPQDKTANSYQDNRTAATALDSKTTNTAQDTKTTTSSQNKKNSSTQETRSTTAAQDARTPTSSCASTTAASHNNSTAHSKAPGNLSGNASLHKSGGKQSGRSAGETAQKGAAILKRQFLEPWTPTRCCEAKEDECGIRRKTFATVSTVTRNKTVLLLGAKGSGKTCLVNAMANFISGVKSDAEKKLTVSDETVKTGGFISTENITGYTFMVKDHDEEEGVALTLIDTPGLNDSSGNEVRDHVESLKKFLANAAHKELEIHGIGLVVQAHLVRLTAPERLVMDHLKALFGQDVSDHVVNLITFADNQSKPPVVEALDHYGMSTRHCFKFNNSVFCGSSEKSEEELDRAYWKTSHKNWKKCWKVVKDLSPLKTNAMKSIQKELYATNVRDAALQDLQAQVKALLQACQAPHSDQVEEGRQRVWDMARVVLRTLQTTNPGNYTSVWSLIEDIVCQTCNEQQALKVTECLLVGSPMQLRDAIVAILKSNYELHNQLKEMEKRARHSLSRKKNNDLKDILFKSSSNPNDAGAFPFAEVLIIENTAKALSHLIGGQFKNAANQGRIVQYLTSLEKEVDPYLHGMIKGVCEHFRK